MTKLMEHTNTNLLTPELEEQLKAFIRSKTTRLEDAEDLWQEVLLQYAKTKNTQAIQHLSGWLHQVARNKIIDLYRKKAPDFLEDYLLNESDEEGGFYQDAILADEETPEDTYWRDEFWEALYNALAKLPEKQRKVFIMNELEDYTLREIAEETNTNLKTTISRKGYAVRQLRVSLYDWYEDLAG